MIGVGVRQNNVSHVIDAKTESLDLTGGRKRLMELEARRVDGGPADALDRISDILQADARIHEGEAAIVFEEEAVAGRRRTGRRVQDAAIQMMDIDHIQPSETY